MLSPQEVLDHQKFLIVAHNEELVGKGPVLTIGQGRGAGTRVVAVGAASREEWLDQLRFAGWEDWGPDELITSYLRCLVE